MKRFALLVLCGVVFSFVVVPDCPAPLIWRKGEGWTYERAGVAAGKDPKEQLEIAQQLHSQKQYEQALAAYRRLVRRWPTSFAAEEGRLGVADCLSALGYHYRAFVEYQQVIKKHPSTKHFDTILQRQFEIGNLFLAGEKHKMWRFRIFSGIDKAVEVYAQIVKNGPYSPVGPEAQFRIGLVHEKQREYMLAVRAYEKFLERYPRHRLAADAQFHIGVAYKKESARAEYDQNAANQAIAAFTDYLIRYPEGDKLAQAQELLSGLKQEQARGLYRIGEYYEKRKHYDAALIYYNEVIEHNPDSNWAVAAKDKVTDLNSKSAPATATP